VHGADHRYARDWDAEITGMRASPAAAPTKRVDTAGSADDSKLHSIQSVERCWRERRPARNGIQAASIKKENRVVGKIMASEAFYPAPLACHTRCFANRAWAAEFELACIVVCCCRPAEVKPFRHRSDSEVRDKRRHPEAVRSWCRRRPHSAVVPNAEVP
jgi:hypothetical protein